MGYIHDWKSNWFNERQFADFLDEDTQIRKHIIGRLSHAGLSDITIRKNQNEVEVNINTARPGIVIGKSGSCRSCGPSLAPSRLQRRWARAARGGRDWISTFPSSGLSCRLPGWWFPSP